MVEIFTTNVNSIPEARIILSLFHYVFPSWKINFDLADVDKILRVESHTEPIDKGVIMRYVKKLGYAIQVLE